MSKAPITDAAKADWQRDPREERHRRFEKEEGGR